MKSAFITGIKGLLGTYLSNHLLEKNYAVYGIDHNLQRGSRLQNISGRVIIYECDVLNKTKLARIIKSVSPDLVFHLAGVNKSNDDEVYFNANVIGTINLLNALNELKKNPRTLVACSSSGYGIVSDSDLPIKETCELRPITPYGVSKASQDHLCYLYYKHHGIRVIRVRIFNNTAPLQDTDFVCSGLARQVAMAEKNKKAVVQVGNVHAVRDFLDSRDVIRAMLLAALHGRPGEAYNVASGKGRTIKSILDYLMSLSKSKIKISYLKKASKSDVPKQIGSYKKLHNATGWKPEIPFKKTLSDLLDYWRSRV